MKVRTGVSTRLLPTNTVWRQYIILWRSRLENIANTWNMTMLSPLCPLESVRSQHTHTSVKWGRYHKFRSLVPSADMNCLGLMWTFLPTPSNACTTPRALTDGEACTLHHLLSRCQVSVSLHFVPSPGCQICSSCAASVAAARLEQGHIQSGRMHPCRG